MGASVYYMANRMRSRLARYGETTDLIGLSYPALGVETLVPSTFQINLLTKNPAAAFALYKKRNFDRYMNSIDKGTSSMRRAIVDYASDCQDSDLILGGYSQGAMAIHQALNQLDAANSEAGYAVAGTLLLGDGDRAPGSRARSFGTAPRRGEGIRNYLHANDGRDLPDPKFSVSICDEGDLVCDFDRSAFRHPLGAAAVHTRYLKSRRGVLDGAVDWLSEELFG